MEIIKRTALAVTFFVLLPTLPAYAANWVYLTTTNNGTDIYYDADTIARSGNQVTVWEKLDHSRDKTFKQRQQTTLIRYDCAGRTRTLLHTISYYPDGTNKSFTFETYEQEVDPIAPGTLGDGKLEAICAATSP